MPFSRILHCAIGILIGCSKNSAYIHVCTRIIVCIVCEICLLPFSSQLLDENAHLIRVSCGL